MRNDRLLKISRNHKPEDTKYVGYQKIVEGVQNSDEERACKPKIKEDNVERTKNTGTTTNK